MGTFRKFTQVATAGLLALACGLSSGAAFAKDYPHDHDNNPPGPAGGPGTNWENPPGPRGGPGASPDRRPDRWVTVRRSRTSFHYVSNGYYYHPHYGYWHPQHGFWNQNAHCWYDRDDNPPGPRGGPGTNWENPPGPRGGPGASPDRFGSCR